MDDRKIVPTELTYMVAMNDKGVMRWISVLLWVVTDGDAEAATLSEDGTTITWKILSNTLNLGGTWKERGPVFR